LANPLVHVGVEVGDGIVARFGDALLLVVEPAQNRERAEDLLAAVEAAVSEAVPPGASVAHRLAAVIAGRPPGATPPFGAVAPLAEGYVVLLHGPVSAEIASPLGVVQLSGDQAVTWVDYKVEVAVDRLSVTSGEPPVQVDPLSDLRAGLVPGSGFVITAGMASTQSNTAGRDAGATASSGGRPAAATLEPQQLGDSAPAQAATSSGRPGQRSVRATEDLNQPVGHLLSADGLRIPLDRAYVVGREPEGDPAVVSGAATPVRLSDDENLISRVHTYIAVEDGRVSLRDAASANGTYMAAPGDESWTRVGEEPTELPPAWSLRVGNLVFTHVAATAAP
jgi:FHA domain